MRDSDSSELSFSEWKTRNRGRSPWTIAGAVAVIAVVSGIVLVVVGYLYPSRTGRAANEAGNPASAPSPTAEIPDANLAKVGDCVRIVKGGPVDAELALVPCGTAGATYTVGLLMEDQEPCPAGPYVEYAARGIVSWSLCLVLNATEGDCFTSTAVDGFTLGDCAPGAVRVTKVLANKADQDACPPPPPDTLDPAYPLVYGEPPRTICLERVT